MNIEETKKYKDIFHIEILKDYKEKLKNEGYITISSKGNFKTGKFEIKVWKKGVIGKI